MKKDFSERIIQWYEENKRSLPWRTTRDPYKIWLSEIILQQTRIAQGLPYYEKFIQNYPDVFSLARAPQKQILRLWQGLGYYTRARNLHACAQVVVKEYGGVFPSTYHQLLTLPGIGSYTAAAIASIAFHEPVAVVDGNVFRVLARIWGIDQDINSPKTKEYFFLRANELIVHHPPDVFNQALMEFGALQCTPRNPDCLSCPVAKLCIANRHHLQHLLPVKIKKQKIRKRYFNYVLMEDAGRVLMRKRNVDDIWQGLYDFFLVETPKPVKPEQIAKLDKSMARLKIQTASHVYKHVLSHQLLMARFIHGQLPLNDMRKLKMNRNLGSYSKKQIERLPKPVLVNQYLKEIGWLT